MWHNTLEIILHLDVYLALIAATMGPWLYLILFLIIFAETGLVVTPFLPGDSLLFATGALCALEKSGLHFGVMLTLMILAAVMGDSLNYMIGNFIGPRVFKSDTSRLFNKEHLVRTNQFYHRYGPITILLARFIPIIRTFAPFVAGVGKMNYSRFATYNVVGGALWVSLFLGGGYFFGNLPWVKHNFHYVIVVIIVVSLAPIAIEYLRTRYAKHRK